ncbi:MAG: TatD family hydrolase [Melioribacteraceae bacterium]|nr:TatD family hydrolase [Melioribacteraceae bacterium]
MIRLNLKNMKLREDHYIDIHTHNPSESKNVITVQNKFVENIIMDNEPMNTLFSFGLHPWHIGNKSELAIMTLKEVVKLDEVIAVGEIGLDKNIDFPLEKQIEFFDQQILIAKSVNKPVIVHCVKSYSDIIKIKKELAEEMPWIIHGFNSSKETAEQLIKHNCYLSFGHLLLTENSTSSKVLSEIDINRIFFETDESEYSIIDIYKKASQLLSVSEEKLRNVIITNFERCFGIG